MWKSSYLAVLTLAVSSGSLRAASFVYATNCCTSGSSVSVVDNLTATQNPGLPVLGSAVAVVMSPNGLTVFAATQDPNLLFAFDTQTGATIKVANLVLEPSTIALSPDGDTVYAAGCTGSGWCGVDVRNASNLSSTATIGLNQNPPSMLALSPDGRDLYATVHPVDPRLHGKHGVVTGVVDIDTATNTVSRFLPMPGVFPAAIVVAPSATTAYIADSEFPFIYAFSLPDGRISAAIQLPSIAAAIALSADGSTLYVSSATLYAISTASNTIVNSWFIDYVTAGLALSPDGAECYVADYYLSTLDTFDLSLGQVTARVPTGFRPVAIAVTPDGATSFAASSGASTVTQINESTNLPAAQMEAGSEPYSVAVSPDGSTVYAANFYSSNVSVLSTAALQRTLNIPTGLSPRETVISPDGARLYVSNSDATITVIDTSSNTVLTSISTSPNGQTLANGLAISADGTTLYALTNFLEFQGILLIDTATDAITGAIRLTGDIAEIAVSPDGQNAYVSGNSSQGFITVVDLPRGRQVQPIPAYKPYGIKVSPDGQFLYTGTTDNPSINVFNRATGVLLSTTPVAGVFGLALSGDGSLLYATGPNLTVYDTSSQSVAAVVHTGGPTLGVAAQ